MARRQHLAVTLVLALVVFFSISYLFTSPSGSLTAYKSPLPKDVLKDVASAEGGFSVDLDNLPTGILEGESIAPKLENATLK